MNWQLAIQVAIGVITVSASFLAARWGALEADRRGSREEWWRRFQWAVDSLYQDDWARTVAGDVMIRRLFDSPLAGEAERQTALEVMWAITVERRPVDAETRRVREASSLRIDRALWLQRVDTSVAELSDELQRTIERADEDVRLYAAETLLERHPLLEFAAIRGGSRADRRISVYVVPGSGTPPEQVRDLVAHHLPERTIQISQLQSIPLTVSGKLNRAALTAENYPPGPPFSTTTEGLVADA